MQIKSNIITWILILLTFTTTVALFAHKTSELENTINSLVYSQDLILRQLEVNEKDIIQPVKDNLFDLTEDEIEKKNIKHLPETLHSAVSEFKKSKLMLEVLGKHLFNKYIDAKEKEWKEYHTTVSEFELRKYLGR